MLFVETFTGIIFIICGLLVKKYPNLIAGYNSMSAEEKKNINIKKLSIFLCNGLIITGGFSIIVAIILFFVKVKPLHRMLIVMMILVLGLIYTLINANKKQ